eukprot:symbB.v1.2.017059.t2/scaffold1320.1/size125405/2
MLIHVVLLSGRSTTIDVAAGKYLRVSDVRRKAQEDFRLGLRCLVTEDGCELEGQQPVASLFQGDIGNNFHDTLTLHACVRSSELCSSPLSTAFALLTADGSVYAWGHPDRGGDAKEVQSQLNDIQQLSCTSGAFCAVRGDGHVITWGSSDLGGRIPPLVRNRLMHVKEVIGSQSAFAALLQNGTVVTWGELHVEISVPRDADTAAVFYDGAVVTRGDMEHRHSEKEDLQDVRAVRSCGSLFAAIVGDERRVMTWGQSNMTDKDYTVLQSLRDVRDLAFSDYAFAALLEDGHVTTWGLAVCGGELPAEVQSELYDIRFLCANHAAFAALRQDGQVLVWGSAEYGGNVPDVVKPSLTEVQHLVASSRAFCAVKADGTVVTWGQDSFGADSSQVQHELFAVQHVVATSRAFAALRSDGEVICWGDARYGGKKSRDAESQLKDVQQLCASSGSFAALQKGGAVAVFENMALKKEIFSQLDEVCKPGCVLASNTSSLNIDEIASATERPQDVIGCHFFSPANVMKLLENVRGPRTGAETMATAMSFGKKLGKVTCLVGNCPGFIANRVMGVSGYTKALAEGVFPHDIDAAAEAYGMRMGPLRMWDLVGIDLFGRERERSGTLDPEKVVFDALYKAERYGQKTGKGFYQYDEKRRHQRDPDAERLLQEVWKATKVEPKTMTQAEIIDNLYLPVVNEGFKCLEEGMAIRASDIDVCCVFGYNWPRYRGGPLKWAFSLGLPKVLAKVEALGLKPSPLLKEAAEKKWKMNSKDFNNRILSAWNATWPEAKL